MGDRKFNFSIGEFYHIYSRGTDRRSIFLESEDWERFRKLLFLCNSSKGIVFSRVPAGKAYIHNRGETLVDIGAFCFMANHFHLLLHEKIENGVSFFMLKLLTAYSGYFNKRHGRTGGLFEGKFKAVHADTDEYLKYLFSYIHLNPIKHIYPDWKKVGIENIEKAKEYLLGYSYSSYFEYIGLEREEAKILNKEAFPEYFLDFKEFDQFVNEWLAFKNVSGID
ncbi:MAG: hypothetical protein EXS47_01735 [Candidatus Zambryskibacteria bacterium]|nr:hypothetical protein [Candidatus Zambryskibacteria bacterium]